MGTLRTLLPYVRGHRTPILIGILCLLISDAFQMVGPWILKIAVDGLETGITKADLAVYAGWLVLMALLAGVTRFFMRRLMIGASREIEYEIRRDFVDHLTRLPHSFYNKTPTGDLMALATNDLNAVRMVLGPGIMYSINTAVILGATLVLMLFLSWKLTLISLIPMPLISLFMYKYGGHINRLFGAVQEQFADITARAQEYLAGTRVVKAYGQEDAAQRDFGERNQEYRRKYMRLIRLNGLMHPVIRFLAGVSIMLVMGFGGAMVIRDTITLGSFVAFFAYLNMLIWPMIALGWVVTIFQRGAASLTRLQATMEIQPEIADPPHVAGSLRPSGDLVFEDVVFAYPSRPDLDVLNGINLTISQGETLGIAGRTGSGKTTLVNLLPRLADPTGGRITFGGVDLRDYPLDDLRRMMGYVTQEAFLFSMNIENNIAFGRPDASPEDIEAMSRMALIHDEVQRFPKGYRTMVGERGVTLSGGQKQRTAIARALLRNPEVLILDDALASVDTRTEEAILAGLRGYMRERTTLLVAHRVSTLALADRIIVVEDGRVIEEGTHAQLLDQGGFYGELARLQQLEDELEATL